MRELHLKQTSHCGGAVINNSIVQWARTAGEVHEHLVHVAKLSGGLWPQLILPSKTGTMDAAALMEERWRVTAMVLARTGFSVNGNGTSRRREPTLGQPALLDVGGVGTYASLTGRHTCINVEQKAHMRLPCTLYRAGSALPYATGAYDAVLAESTLHHAAAAAPALVAEMARVASESVVVVEDVLEAHRASEDVRRAYERHDRRAIYRGLEEWLKLGSQLGLTLRHVALLHRVPIHVQDWTTTNCELGFAPIVYLLWSKQGARRQQAPASIDEEKAFLKARRQEERAHNLMCCNPRKCMRCELWPPPRTLRTMRTTNLPPNTRRAREHSRRPH